MSHKRLPCYGSPIVRQHIDWIEREYCQIQPLDRVPDGMLDPLPPALQKRVDRIMKSAELRRIADAQKRMPQRHDTTTRPEDVATSHAELIVSPEKPEFEVVHIAPPPSPPPPPPLTTHRHWLSDYVAQTAGERICWPSKLHRQRRQFANRPLFDQTEHMLRLAAADFAEWLAQLGSTDRQITVTEQRIVQMFSIGDGSSDGCSAARALRVQPHRRCALPTSVANALGQPKFGVERNVRRLRRSDEAAGSADFWSPEQPHFPVALRTKRTLFEGIDHLRSTQALVGHLVRHPTVERPEFLVQAGCFGDRPETMASMQHRPLYGKFVRSRAE